MQPLFEILESVNARIDAACKRAGRDAKEVKLIAVTKTHGADTVREAHAEGLRLIGENKVQEAMFKKPECPSSLEWHLIGHLQTNKVRHALMTFDYFHSIDSVKLLDKIEQVAEEMGLKPKVLLEVNVAGEKSKTGMKIEDVPVVLEHAMMHCPRIDIQGFMTMAPFSPKAEDARPYFRRLKELQVSMRKASGLFLGELSMGMSGDFEVAIEEGATFIRLGTVLFGERPKLKRTVSADNSDFPSLGLDSYDGGGPTVKILD